MRNFCALKTRAAVAAAALVLLPLAGLAKDGRDFAGFYSVNNIVEQGDQLVVTLQVQLFNHAGSDVKQAVVTLRPSSPSPVPVGAFHAVKLWRNHGEVRLSQQFAVPRQEVERWLTGSQPALMVVYRDPQGKRLERFVQLSSRAQLPH